MSCTSQCRTVSGTFCKVTRTVLREVGNRALIAIASPCSHYTRSVEALPKREMISLLALLREHPQKRDSRKSARDSLLLPQHALTTREALKYGVNVK